MSVPGADASAAAAPAGGPATGKKKKLGKKERQRLKAIADGTYVAPVLPQKQPPKAKQARQPYNGGMAPSLLTKYIKEAWTTTALLETCEQYQDRMNKIHASASWNRLGRLATAAADARWFERDRAALEALARKTTEMVLASVDVGSSPADDASANAVMGARELANVAHGLAKCGAARASDEPETFSSGTTFFDDDDDVERPFGERDALPRTNGFILSRTHDRRDGEKDADENENASSDPTRALIAALAKALTVRARECNAQEAANAAWAFRKLGREGDPELYEALAFVARREAANDAMNPQELANAAWAFSGVLAETRRRPEKAGDLKNDGENDDERDAATNASINVSFAEDMARTVETLASSAANRLASFDARGVCVLTCALAKANAGAPAGSDERRVPNAFAKATRLLAAETTSRVSRYVAEDAFAKHDTPAAFSARDVAASSWAFASLDFFDEALFAALARVSTAMCARDAFDARALANVAWAHAKASAGDEAGRRDLFSGVARALTRRAAVNDDRSRSDGSTMPSRDIANAVWAFAKACHPDDALFDALLLRVQTTDPRLERFNNQDLVNAAWAYAKLAARGAQALFAAMRATVKARADADAFTAANITTLVWATRGGETEASDAEANETSADVSFASVSEALARAAARACVGSSAVELAATAWTFADAGALRSEAHRDLFRALGARVSAILDAPSGLDANDGASFGDEELDNLEWAFSKAGNPGNVLRRVKHARSRRVSSFRSNDAFMTVAHAGVGDPSADAASVQNGTRRPFVKNENASCGTIVVSGGGIGGAAAALALQREGFDVVVLESDAAFDARKQGYGLTVQGTDLRDGLGIDLAADDAPSTSHYTFAADGSVLAFFGEAFGGKGGQRLDHAAETHKAHKKGNAPSARFAHVPRQIMRLRMLERLKPGTIRWGSRMRSFRLNAVDAGGERSDATTKDVSRRAVTVELEDGSTLDACLLVGSDGIHSTTRRLLRLRGGGDGDAKAAGSVRETTNESSARSRHRAEDPDALTYCGLAVVLGIVDDATFLARLAKRRVFETVDGRVRVYAMPFTARSTMWQLSFPCSESDARRYAKDPPALKENIESLCANWHHPIPGMLRETRLENVAGYPVYDREPLDPGTLRPFLKGSRSLNPRRVTLIGDAAHPMTPFKAQGANQAVADAVLLARSLSDNVRALGVAKGIDAALPVFEKKMLARASRVVRASRDKARELHSPLALAPARKAQRESGADVDMARVIARCRAEGVRAAHGGDARADLDAVVQAVGFGGKTLAQLGLPVYGDAGSASGGSEKKEKKEKKAKKAKKEKKEKKKREEREGKKKAHKRERSPGSEAKKAKKAKKEASG